eukprot:3514003-Rhodomonas_salina.1
MHEQALDSTGAVVAALACLDVVCRLCPLAVADDDPATEDKKERDCNAKGAESGQEQSREKQLSRFRQRWKLPSNSEDVFAHNNLNCKTEWLRAEHRLLKETIMAHKLLSRRSVARALELLDDAAVNEALLHTANEELQLPAAELFIDDVQDCWEARVLGMLCVRASSIHCSDQDPLPLTEIASGDRQALRLKAPVAHKTAAFLAFFVSASAPNYLTVSLGDDTGMDIEMRPD